ncbi:MAG: hypothetical protein ACKOU7_10945 [Ferruginibacter sp.]
MKTLLFSFCFLLALTYPSFSQNRVTDSSATCIAFWSKNDNRVYKITHSKAKFDQRAGKSVTESNYEAHLKVIDSSATGFTIEWTYRNFAMSGAAQHSLNSLETIMEGLKFVYKTDEVGMFTELINWEEVRDFAFSNYEKAIAGKSQNSEFVVALNQVKSIFKSKENIEAILIKEVQLFHAPFGREYNRKAEVFETELPNVTGGAPFPATITISLDELNVQQDSIRISINQTIDKGKAGPIIADILKKLSVAPIKDEAEMKKQVKDMEISDINQYSVTLSSGWINRIYFKRTSNIGPMKQIESYLISRIK